jgi:hypothetical protein
MRETISTSYLIIMTISTLSNPSTFAFSNGFWDSLKYGVEKKRQDAMQKS